MFCNTAMRIMKLQVLRFSLVWMITEQFVAKVDAMQDEFLNSLEDYEVIVPSRVTEEGQHITYELHPSHSLRRRSTGQVEGEQELHYSLHINNENHLVRLRPNTHLVTPGFVVERKKNRFKNVTDSRFSFLAKDKSNCHFHGEIANQSDTKVALGLCHGMQGLIHTKTGQYFIEPLEKTPDGQHRHVVYRRAALPEHLDPVRFEANRRKREAGDNSCGTKDFIQATAQRERWERHHRRRRQTGAHHRSKRSFSTERYVETLVVVDPSMIKYHKNEHLETYVLTIMNMVAAMFHDASIGNSINIVLVRILLLEEEQEELVITHHADKTLKSFCKFQKTINFKDDDHPNHHDVAVLLTRKNICSRLNEPCGTLGLAQVSGMCQPHRSCSISEDTGLALAYTVTHELGHNFGMHHDGSNNGCEDPPGKQLFIMSPSLVADSIPKSWSSCSKQAITQFIDRDWGYCLDDEPTTPQYTYPVLPPGTMYDADHQCRLQYGNDDATICTNEQDVCSNLWCKTENRCSTHLEAAAEGTICGTNKWCFEGKCVKIGDRPEAINGEWGEWTGWTECTRTCGAGVSHSQRHCDNPAPSNGGKYCLGERKRYRICNTENCGDTDTTFNDVQCAEFNYIPYKNGIYEWEHVSTPETPCQLHCKPKNHFFSVLMKDIIADGTPCTPGTRNMCISGRCRHVGCDYVIDSKAQEDRCGVCHGDGSTCTTVKSQFNDSQGLGYIEAAVIPEGARNIRVEEVAAASNFLALQNSKGEYFLNGNWFIQWSGDYKAAGTTIQYTREGNKEMVVSPGPLKEPLHVMLLLQSSNPGVLFEYTVPKENVTEQRQPEFHWAHQPWTHCTASCGGGSQRSEVICKELEAGIVDDKYCNASLKPDDIQRVCNDHLCPARWWTGPWQHCSVTCGDNGVHHRTVICVRSLGLDEQIALDDEACEAEEKPSETEPCHKKEPCPRNSTWIVGEWSSCNGNPCGQKYRKVECKEPEIGCDVLSIPASEMSCTEIPCGEYVALEWSECTRTCGDGIQTRQVYCEGSDFCDTSKKPETQRHCNEMPCSSSTSLISEATTTKSIQVASERADTKAISSTKTYDIITKTENLHSLSHSLTSLSSTQTATNEANVHSVVGTMSSANMKTAPPIIQTFTDKSNITEGKSLKEAGKVHDTDNENVATDIIEKLNQNITEMKDETTTGTAAKLEPVEPNDIENYPTVPNTERPGIISVHSHTETLTTIPTTVPVNITVDDVKTQPSPPTQKVSTVTQEYDIKHRHNHENFKPRHETSKSSATHDHQHGTLKEQSTSQINDFAIPATDVSETSTNVTYTTETDTSDESITGYEIKFSESDFEPIPDIDNLPLVPEGDLPALPDINDLPPLPKLEDLPPISDVELPKLPKLGKPNIAYIHFDKPVSNQESPVISHEGTSTIDINIAEGDETLYSLSKGTSEPKEIEKPTLNAKVTSNQLPQAESSQDIRPVSVPEINVDKETQLSIGSLNDSWSDSINLASHPFKGMPEKGPVMPRLELANGDSNYSWTPLDWTECSRQCGGGVRTRLVECLHTESDGTVEQTHCDINTKPTAIEVCNTSPCLEWVTSEWGQCSEPCGKSIRQRVVSCPRGGPCDAKVKPASEEICDVPTCVTWVSGQWSKCSKECDGGEQLRLVQCVDVTSQMPSTGCDASEKPEEKQECNKEPCKDNNAALSLRCESNEMSAAVCRALLKMGQCQNRFVALKCCKTCSTEAHRLANKDRPKMSSLR